MQSLQNAVQTQFWAVRDYLAPVLKDSKFKEHGRITPDEFVIAGDFLVYKFPTWQWESGDKSKARDYLPADKQYLVQRNVPCIRRVAQMQNYGGADKSEEDKETLLTFKADELLNEPDAPGDEWVATHTGTSRAEGGLSSAESIPDIPDSAESASASEAGLTSKLAGLKVQDISSSTDPASATMPDMDDIPDIEDEAGAEVIEPEDEAAVPAGNFVGDSATSGNTLSVRTYDCFITYDKYYQVPRMWLFGLSPSRQALTTEEIFQDVSSDYASKTVTIEPFPHKENVQMASVHPCKHSNVMKKVIERMNNAVKEAQKRQIAIDAGEATKVEADPTKEKEKKKKGWGVSSIVKKATGSSSSPPQANDDEVEGLRVDQYLLVFLKFLSNVVPTIELDATTSL